MTTFVAAVLLIALFERTSVVSGFACYSMPSSHQMPTRYTTSRQQAQLELMHDESDDNEVAESTSSGHHVSIDSSRRAVMQKSMISASISLCYTILTCTETNNPAWAASSIKPDDAYQGLLKAREELVTAAKKYLPSRDYDGMRTFLAEEAVNMNNYESNAQALLTSKRLDNESKKEIGTIRRYGVGADVIIMYGGLRSELDDNEYPNGSEVQKYLTRSLDSLQEVIVICQNNGF